MTQETAEFLERASCIACSSKNLLPVCAGSYTEDPVRGYIASDPWGDDPLPYLRGQRWEYVRCEACDQAFHRFVLTPEWNEIRFSRWMTQAAIAEFEAKVDTPQRRFRKASDNAAHALRLEKMTRDIRGDSAVRVLDFGCGYGEFLSMCSQFGFDAIGIDRSTARRDNSKHTRIFAEISDLRDAPEGAAGFHALTLFEVLEHLDDPAPLLEELKGFLVDGGVLVLETPNCSGVTAIDSRSNYLKIAPMEHINGFTPQTLQAFAERLGFELAEPPIAQVTTQPLKVLKNEVRRLAGGLIKPTTRLYFRKRA